MTRRVVLFLLLTTLGHGQQRPKPDPPLRVLFVGNSYTYFNDLPWMVAELGRRAKPARRIVAESTVRGGATLEWHAGERRTKEAISRGRWAWVVLQEQSLRPLQDRALMAEHGRTLHLAAKARGAKTLLFMTWARKARPKMQKGLTEAYDGLARSLGAQVAPVGLAFQAVLKQRPKLDLHAPDGSHPTPAGTYLAALIFWAKLTGGDPVGLPARLVKDGKEVVRIAPDVAKLLQKTARDLARRKVR